MFLIRYNTVGAPVTWLACATERRQFGSPAVVSLLHGFVPFGRPPKDNIGVVVHDLPTIALGARLVWSNNDTVGLGASGGCRRIACLVPNPVHPAIDRLPWGPFRRCLFRRGSTRLPPQGELLGVQPAEFLADGP